MFAGGFYEKTSKKIGRAVIFADSQKSFIDLKT